MKLEHEQKARRFTPDDSWRVVRAYAQFKLIGDFGGLNHPNVHVGFQVGDGPLHESTHGAGILTVPTKDSQLLFHFWNNRRGIGFSHLIEHAFLLHPVMERIGVLIELKKGEGKSTYAISGYINAGDEDQETLFRMVMPQKVCYKASKVTMKVPDHLVIAASSLTTSVELEEHWMFYTQ